MIAHICHLTGWHWDYVEQTLTMTRLKALYAEWQRNPPLPVLFAAWLGIKPQEKGSAGDLVERLKGIEQRNS